MTYLRRQPIDRAAIDAGCRDLLGEIGGADSSVTLDIASSMWYREGLPIEAGYASRGKDVFGAEVRALDFGAAEAPGTINNWVKANTQGRIEKIVESIKTDMVLLLINARLFMASKSTSKRFL